MVSASCTIHLLNLVLRRRGDRDLDASVDGAPPRCHFPRGTSRAARLPSLERAYELGMAARVRR